MSKLGPAFIDDLTAAGLRGLPFGWRPDGTIVGRENLSEAQNAAIDAVIAMHDPEKPARYLVRKSTIVVRLQVAGKLTAASAALDADLYARERWYAPDKPAVYADDPEALALLSAIGADPAVIMAPE